MSNYLGRFFAGLIPILLILVMVVVIGRYFFGIGRVDIQELALYVHALIFLGCAGWAYSADEPVRVDIFYRNASPGYKQMIVDSAANDIMYSPTFTGVHGNYLKPSVVNAGLDPDNLPHADKNDMNFGSSGLSGDNSKKAWKDIWGSGQGIGPIKEITSVKDTVDKLVSEYQSSKQRLDKIS